MMRSSLLYLTLAAALLSGMAHLRADWLGGAPGRPEPDRPRAVDRVAASAAWSAGQGGPRQWCAFLRPR